MNELYLFAAAIGIADPSLRAALLERECAGRPEVRNRLDQLLAAHFKSTLTPRGLAGRSPISVRNPGKDRVRAKHADLASPAFAGIGSAESWRGNRQLHWHCRVIHDAGATAPIQLVSPVVDCYE